MQIFVFLYSLALADNGEKADELENIKSTYRLPTRPDGSPVIQPNYYDVDLFTYGLKESDRNSDGHFDFSGVSRVFAKQNLESYYIVLHAGDIPGYEILAASVRRNNEHGAWIEYNTTFEHYREKEFLIIENTDAKFQQSGGRFDLMIEVSYKAWLYQEFCILYH